MSQTDVEEIGYSFAFAPADPIDPEYRQIYAEAQKRWLEQWEPLPQWMQ